MNASAETDTVYIPPSTEHVSCVVCGADEPIPVGAKARFNMDVSSVTCARCGLVYITPRPTIEDMARYYATSYRIHYGSVGAIRADGTRITPDSPDWEAYTDGRYQHQAELVAPLLQPGAKVLEMGCRYGRTLSLLADKHGAIPYGIEPGETDAEKARWLDGTNASELQLFPPGAEGEIRKGLDPKERLARYTRHLRLLNGDADPRTAAMTIHKTKVCSLARN